MKSIEIKAKSYEKALEMAVEMTGKTLDELDFVCLKEPRLFFKGVYKVTIEKEDLEEKTNNIEKKDIKTENQKQDKQNIKTENQTTTKNHQEKSQNNHKNNNNFKNNNNHNNTQHNKNFNNQNKKPLTNNVKEKEEIKKIENKQEPKKIEPKQEVKKVVQEVKVEEVKKVEDKVENKEDNTLVVENNNKVEVSTPELDHFIRNFIVEFAGVQGVTVEVEVQIRDGNKFFVLTGTDAHKLIGYHGENLNAMQYIIAAVVNEKYSVPTRILLDIGNYKEKREESLKMLARKTARKVIQTRRSQKLEPMNANERRIIHSELQSNQKVTTESHGTEPYRFVVIKLK